MYLLFPLSLLSFRKNRYNQAHLEFRKETVNIPGLTGFLVTPILYRDRSRTAKSRGGGIGRHKGLKIPRGKPRAGSSPALGTR